MSALTNQHLWAIMTENMDHDYEVNIVMELNNDANIEESELTEMEPPLAFCRQAMRNVASLAEIPPSAPFFSAFFSVSAMLRDSVVVWFDFGCCSIYQIGELWSVQGFDIKD